MNTTNQKKLEELYAKFWSEHDVNNLGGRNKTRLYEIQFELFQFKDYLEEHFLIAKLKEEKSIREESIFVTCVTFMEAKKLIDMFPYSMDGIGKIKEKITSFDDSDIVYFVSYVFN